METESKQNKNKDESSIGAVNVCNRYIVHIEMVKIVLWFIGVDFTETRKEKFCYKKIDILTF